MVIQGLVCGSYHIGVVCQTQVIVGTEIQYLCTTQDFYLNILRRGDDAFGTTEQP